MLFKILKSKTLFWDYSNEPLTPTEVEKKIEWAHFWVCVEVIPRDRVVVILRNRIQKKKRQRKPGGGFGSVGLVPGVVLFHSLKTLKQKTWEMFSDQLHILGVEVFPFHVSQTSYTTHLISIWMTSITSRWEINSVCQNIFTFLQENVPIKLRIIKNLNLYFVIWDMRKPHTVKCIWNMNKTHLHFWRCLFLLPAPILFPLSSSASFSLQSPRKCFYPI